MSKKPNIAAEAIETYGTRYASNETLFTCLGIPQTAVQDLLIKAESLAGIAKMTLREISAVKGIGRAKAATIVAAIEIGRRRQTEESKNLFKESLATSYDAFNLIQAQMRDLTQDQLW
jgi:DNA repair protein RadC